MRFSFLRRLSLAVFFLCLALACFSGAASAQGPDTLKIDANTQAYARGDVDDRNGKYSVSRTNVTARYRWFTLSYRYSHYDWSHPRRLPFGNGDDPWESFHRIALDGRTSDFITEDLEWFGGATVVSSFEDEVSRSFSLIGRAGLRYAITPDLRVSAGAAGFLSYAHPMILPLVGIEWRNEEDYGFSATLGYPSTALRYRFNDLVRLRATNTWSRDLTRLANDSNVRRKGYVEESAYTAGAYLDLTPLAGLVATVGVEYQYDRRMSIYNKSGHRKGKYDVDDAFGGIFSLGYSF